VQYVVLGASRAELRGLGLVRPAVWGPTQPFVCATNRRLWRDFVDMGVRWDKG
jgi:hypothetical protein